MFQISAALIYSTIGLTTIVGKTDDFILKSKHIVLILDASIVLFNVLRLVQILPSNFELLVTCQDPNPFDSLANIAMCDYIIFVIFLHIFTN